MILHVALYRFRTDAQEEQIEQCKRELQVATKRTELVSWYLSGSHIALPADEAVRDIVYDFSALWGFADQKALDEFSRHPAIAQCVAAYIRPVVDRLAIVNFSETTDIFWEASRVEEKKYAS
jgi:hypothetical protein